MSHAYYNPRTHYQGPSFPYNQLTPEQRVIQYDAHNPGSRESNNPQERLYGRCGCPACAQTRTEWSRIPAALNKPGREGSGSMASVNLCDRTDCKSMVQGRALGRVALSVSSAPGGEILEREICPGCVADVVTLLETAPVTPRDGAYREPYKRPVPDDDALDTATDEQLAANLFQRMMRRQHAIDSAKPKRGTEPKGTDYDDDTYGDTD